MIVLDLPERALYSKRIPKEHFYTRTKNASALKRFFVEQIEAVYWRYKLATDTVSLAAGQNVKELQVFEMPLKQRDPDDALLKAALESIDRAIQYSHLLFMLTRNDTEKSGSNNSVQAWIAYKEIDFDANEKALSCRVKGYYHTPWQPREQLSLSLKGTDLDGVYENYVRQIAALSDNPIPCREGESLAASLARSEQIRMLEKQIESLRGKLRREAQINRQFEINDQLKKLTRELAALR